MSEGNTNKIPAVDRAVALLECLGNSRFGMTQAELCRTLDITQSTCYRIIQTLLEHGWICRSGRNSYDIAPGILSVSRKLTDVTRRFEHLQPQLEALSKQTGLSSKLSIRQGGEQVTVLRAESPRPMTVSGRVGARFPVIEGSVGAALLCETEKEDIIGLSAECVDNIKEKGDPAIIFRRINDLKGKGYCLNSRENRWKVDAMSTVVPDSSGQMAVALTLIGFDDDFGEKKIASLVEALRDAAEGCSKALFT